MANSRSRGGGSQPARGNSTTARDEVPFNQRRFVRIELNDEQKQEVKSFIADGEITGDVADYFSREGYVCSWKAMDGGKTVFVSIACIDREHPNAGLIITGRGRDFATALAVCAYKDKYCCEDHLWATGEDYNPDDADDIG